MAEETHRMTEHEFVSQICRKIREFQQNLTAAFTRTVHEINLDRTEILALSKRVEALEHLVAGLPPKMDS